MNSEIEDSAVKFFLLVIGFLFGVISCSQQEALEVRQFHLRTTEVPDGHEFIRGEVNQLLHGAVTLEERRRRLGDYYTVRWREVDGAGEVTILFEYRQEIGGALVRQKRVTLPSAVRGKVRFEVAGEEFQKRGRVLSWRVTLRKGGREIGQKQSFLWD